MTQIAGKRTAGATQAEPWRALLQGELAKRASATVEEIAAGLRAYTRVLAAPDAADAALFFGYLARVNGDENHAAAALDYLNKAINGYAPVPALFSGFIRSAWAVTQLQGKLFSAEEADDCLNVDEGLTQWVQTVSQPVDYDLVAGLTGIGVYALAHLPAPSALACLQAVLQKLAATAEHSAAGISWHTPPELLPAWQRKLCPNGYYNLGLAHGVPGVVALLARASAVPEVHEQAVELLEGAVRWLLAQRQSDQGVPFFPAWIAPEIEPKPGRPTWCYGDLGLATALLYAARCVARAGWEAGALSLL